MHTDTYIVHTDLFRDDGIINFLKLRQAYFYEVSKSWEDLVTAGGITKDAKLGPRSMR